MPEDEKPPAPIPTSAAAETEAMMKVADALIPLDGASRGRVMRFVIDYFGIRFGGW